MKVKDLVDIQTIQEIVQLSDYEPEEIIPTYIFTDHLASQMEIVLKRLIDRQEKNSFMVIGNYGSGKSHFLAFIASLAKEPAMWQKIRGEKVRGVGEQLAQRSLFLVEYELPAIQRPLSYIFYDRVLRALREYGIEIGFAEHEYDPRERADKILGALYEHFGSGTGLVVVFDEMADFLAAKEGPRLREDLAFLRDLGEISRTHNTTFVTSLQEDLLRPDHPWMLPYAQEINRILQRFEKVTLGSENLKKVAAERILIKTDTQRKKLMNLYSTLKKRFPDLKFGEAEFVDLYPIHPMVFEIYERLVRYLGNRSVLKFVSQESLRIADAPPDTLITPDRILQVHRGDLATSPDAIQLLNAYENIAIDVLPRLDVDVRHLATKALDTLVILSLVERRLTVVNLAHALLIAEYEGRLNYDSLDSALRDMAAKSGQYFTISGDGLDRVYELVPTEGPNVEAMIQTRMATLNDEDPRLVKIVIASYLGEQLGFKELSPDQSRSDQLLWKSTNTRRSGKVRLVTRALSWTEVGEMLLPETDYLLLIEGLFTSNNGLKRADIRDERVSLWHPGSLDPETLQSLKRDLAIRLLLVEKSGEPLVVETLKGKLASHEDTAKNAVRRVYYEKGEIGGAKRAETNLSLFWDQFDRLKSTLFDAPLNDYYEEHPRFGALLSGRQQVNRLISEFVARKTYPADGSAIASYIENFALPLDLAIAAEEYYLKPESKYLKVLEKKIDDATSPHARVADLSGVALALRQKPYGLQEPIFELLLAALLRLGKVILISAKGDKYPVSRFDEAIDLGFRKFEAVEKSGLVSEPDRLRELLFALGCSIGPINSLDDQDQAYEQSLKLREAYDFEALEEGLEQLPFSAEELMPTLEKARNVLTPVLAELQPKRASKEAFEAVLVQAKSLRALKKAGEDFDQLQALVSDGLRLRTIKAYLDESLPQSEKLKKEREMLLTMVTPELADNERRRRFLQGFEEFRSGYIDDYTAYHEETVGELAPFDKVAALLESEAMAALRTLQGLRLQVANSHAVIKGEIEAMLVQKCFALDKDALLDKPLCGCRFPLNGGIDVEAEYHSLEREIADTLTAYEQAILSEQETIRENLEDLNDATMKKRVRSFLQKGKLDLLVEEEFVKALNVLLEKIIQVEIDLVALVGKLSAVGKMTWADFRQGLIEAIDAAKPEGVPEERVRVVVK